MLHNKSRVNNVVYYYLVIKTRVRVSVGWMLAAESAKRGVNSKGETINISRSISRLEVEIWILEGVSLLRLE